MCEASFSHTEVSLSLSSTYVDRRSTMQSNFTLMETRPIMWLECLLLQQHLELLLGYRDKVNLVQKLGKFHIDGKFQQWHLSRCTCREVLESCRWITQVYWTTRQTLTTKAMDKLYPQAHYKAKMDMVEYWYWVSLNQWFTCSYP